jgi:hypothetical protein
MAAWCTFRGTAAHRTHAVPHTSRFVSAGLGTAERTSAVAYWMVFRKVRRSAETRSRGASILNGIVRDHDIARTDQGGSEGVPAPTLHRARKYKSLKFQLQA